MTDAGNQGSVVTHLEGQSISDGRPTRVRWIVLALVSFASASAYLTRYCISAANTTIQRDLEFDDEQMGAIMSAFALGYLFCQVPGGWLGNRFGTRLAFAGISLFGHCAMSGQVSSRRSTTCGRLGSPWVCSRQVSRPFPEKFCRTGFRCITAARVVPGSVRACHWEALLRSGLPAGYWTVSTVGG